MTARNSSALREEAQRLYVDRGLSAEETAGRLGTDPAAVADWACRGEWDRRRREAERRAGELEELLERIKLRLARLAMSDEDEEEGVSPQHLNALCKVVAVLSPPASVTLRRLEREEESASRQTAADRMNRVMDLLKGEGFVPDETEES